MVQKLRLILLLLGMIRLWPSAAMSQDSLSHMGVRFGYGIEFPSVNHVGIQELTLFEAGHRLNYGAVLDLPVSPKAKLGLFAGLEHQFWPKSQSYVDDCTLDSFPTFMALDDSLPGRNHRLIMFAFEPSLRFHLKPSGLSVRISMFTSFVLQSKVEEYVHTCSATPFQGYVDYTETADRQMQKFNLGFGIGLCKKVWINERSGFLIECGPRVMLSSLFRIRGATADQPSFSLTPWGMQVNLSFVR